MSQSRILLRFTVTPDMSGTIERIEYQINMLIGLVYQIVEASPELVERLIDTQWRYKRPKE